MQITRRNEMFTTGHVCQCCGGRINLVEKEYHTIGVCSACAEVIANLYSHAHSGEFLTWENNEPTTPTKNRKSVNASLALAVFRRDEFACKHCGSHDNLTVDHKTPVSKGGGNDMENLQTFCGMCNCKKGVKPENNRGVDD